MIVGRCSLACNVVLCQLGLHLHMSFVNFALHAVAWASRTVKHCYSAAARAIDASAIWQMGKPSTAHRCVCHVIFCAVVQNEGGPHRGSHRHNADQGLLHCRRMFETAVAVGVYHKSDNSININPDEKTVFQPGDPIVVLSNTGNSLFLQKQKVQSGKKGVMLQFCRTLHS